MDLTHRDYDAFWFLIKEKKKERERLGEKKREEEEIGRKQN